jgi:rhamnosyltransferase
MPDRILVNSKKIAIGIVTYKPNSRLFRRLKDAIESGYSVYIFDNSPYYDLTRQFCNKSNGDIKYITCGKNVGLGLGISSVCANAYFDSHPALLFFDQDTIFNGETLEFVNAFYDHNNNITNNYSAIVFNCNNITSFDNNEFKKNLVFKDVALAINSGSLFFLQNLKKLNWHSDKFFVDGVDYDFCLNSSNNNFKIGECSITPGFDHQTEQDDTKYLILGKIHMMREYPNERILDALTSNIKLIISSVRARNFSFTVKFSRLLFGYVYYQTLARIFRKRKV